MPPHRKKEHPLFDDHRMRGCKLGPMAIRRLVLALHPDAKISKSTNGIYEWIKQSPDADNVIRCIQDTSDYVQELRKRDPDEPHNAILGPLREEADVTVA